MALTPHTRLGPYEIIAPLGAGGMGEVYRARDTRLGREVALKILPATAPYEGSRLRRFEQEARALAALNHPNLLVIFDVGEADGTPYLASELLTGEPLDARLRSGAIAPRKAVELARQIAEGLAAAHEAGIVHRDLKPANLFITSDGRVKILDFGLAKLTETASAEAVTQAADATGAGVTLGTVGYMSPEQVKGEAVDARSDIFAFGAVLYEMLTGERAFKRATGAETMTAILREEPPDNAATAPTSAPALDTIIRRCLEKTPRQRFQSANDLGIALELALGGSVSSGAAPALTAPASRQTWRMAALLAAAAVLASGATWWWARTPAEVPAYTQLTYQQGTIWSARFLPDGQSVILAANFNNQPTALFTGRLDVPGLEPLAAANVHSVLAVAPGETALLLDWRSLAGYSGYGTLARMPLSGGSPRAMLDSVQFADYAPGSTNLAIVRYEPGKTDYTLEYPIGNVLYRSAWISDVRFSRDGRQIAFLDHPTFGDDLGYVAVTDLSGHERRLAGPFAATQGLAWSPRGNEVWFTAATQGIAYTLRAVTLSGQVRELATAPAPMELFDVLATGRTLVESQSRRVETSLVSAALPQPRDLTVLGWTNSAAMSADGQKILVGDEQGGPRYATYLRTPDGAPPVRLGDGDALAISPDGQWAASTVPQSQQIQLLPTGAGEPRTLTHGAVAFFLTRDAWLPNGQAIIARGYAPHAREREYEISLTGTERAVTPEGVIGAVVTPDSSAVLAGHAAQWAIYPLNGGQPQPVAALGAGDVPLRYTSDGHSLWVERQAPDLHAEVWRVDLASRQRVRAFVVSPPQPAGVRNVAVSSISADGKSYTVFSVLGLDALYTVSGLR